MQFDCMPRTRTRSGYTALCTYAYTDTRMPPRMQHASAHVPAQRQNARTQAHTDTTRTHPRTNGHNTHARMRTLNNTRAHMLIWTQHESARMRTHPRVCALWGAALTGA